MKLYNHIIKDYIIASPLDAVLTYRKNILNDEPVVVQENGEFVGIVTINDIVNKQHNLIIDSFYPKPTVQIDDDSLSVLLLMCKNNFDFLPVMKADEFCGIVSRKKLFLDILQLQDDKEDFQKDEEVFALRKELSLKNKFFIILGHDIKNLFMQVLGSLELLDQRLHRVEEPKVQGALRLARRSAEQVTAAFEGMLLWARIGTGQLPFRPEELQLKEHIDKIVNQFQLAGDVKNISIKNSLENDLVIFADPNMLGCVLLNLVYNAIKFTQVGGDISLNAIQYEDKTEIHVTDNGLGMSWQQQQQLFTQGNSTIGTSNEMGTGIGLVICKEFVEKHSGKIEVESAHGKGTRVIVTFPRLASVYKYNESIAAISQKPM